MRTTYIILMCVMLVMACLQSCRKDPKDIGSLSCAIQEKNRMFVKDNDVVSAEMLATCSFSGPIKKVTLQMSFCDDMSDAVEVEAVKEGEDYRASFPVVMDTEYYYQYIAYRYSDEFDMEMEIKSDQVYSLSTRDVRLPSVTTKAVKYVSQTHALGWGRVTDDCGESVSQRGVCWSLQTKPGLSDNYGTDGEGVGDCYVQMNELIPGAYYHVRAFAKNRFGVSYGEEKTIRTTPVGAFSVETMKPSYVERNSAKLRGKYVPLSDRVRISGYGFFYGLTPITDIHISSSIISNTIFSQTVSSLEEGANYWVRAYAIDALTSDTIFGEMISFTTKASAYAPVGELNGLFSVSPTLQVQFSPGNLQYQASTDKWRFPRQQWDFIGEGNKNISATYSGWIDLFGWGTSGNDHGAVCYQPWSNSINNSDYYAYGSQEYNLYDRTGLADWGSNTIYLGDEATQGWRTMTSEEWNYVLMSRNTTSGIRFAKAQLNIADGTDMFAVNGVILFPDDWNDNGMIGHPNDEGATYSSNIVFSSEWKEEYEPNGAVFLPAAGRRSGTWFYDEDQLKGYYWSASKFDNRVRHFYCTEDELGADYLSYRYYGYSVRLVRSSN